MDSVVIPEDPSDLEQTESMNRRVVSIGKAGPSDNSIVWPIKTVRELEAWDPLNLVGYEIRRKANDDIDSPKVVEPLKGWWLSPDLFTICHECVEAHLPSGTMDVLTQFTSLPGILDRYLRGQGSKNMDALQRFKMSVTAYALSLLVQLWDSPAMQESCRRWILKVCSEEYFQWLDQVSLIEFLCLQEGFKMDSTPDGGIHLLWHLMARYDKVLQGEQVDVDPCFNDLNDTFHYYKSISFAYDPQDERQSGRNPHIAWRLLGMQYYWLAFIYKETKLSGMDRVINISSDLARYTDWPGSLFLPVSGEFNDLINNNDSFVSSRKKRESMRIHTCASPGAWALPNSSRSANSGVGRSRLDSASTSSKVWHVLAVATCLILVMYILSVRRGNGCDRRGIHTNRLTLSSGVLSLLLILMYILLR